MCGGYTAGCGVVSGSFHTEGQGLSAHYSKYGSHSWQLKHTIPHALQKYTDIRSTKGIAHPKQAAPWRKIAVVHATLNHSSLEGNPFIYKDTLLCSPGPRCAWGQRTGVSFHKGCLQVSLQINPREHPKRWIGLFVLSGVQSRPVIPQGRAGQRLDFTAVTSDLQHGSRSQAPGIQLQEHVQRQ